ncbi:MAG: hypothetical protein AAGA00_15365 [Pseudomonadota bacterium]
MSEFVELTRNGHVLAVKLNKPKVNAIDIPMSQHIAAALAELRDRMVNGCNEVAAVRHFEDMAAERDRAIVGVLKAVAAAKAANEV